MKTWPDNLLVELLYSVDSCSWHSFVTARQNWEWPGTILPLSKTFCRKYIYSLSLWLFLKWVENALWCICNASTFYQLAFSFPPVQLGSRLVTAVFPSFKVYTIPTLHKLCIYIICTCACLQTHTHLYSYTRNIWLSPCHLGGCFFEGQLYIFADVQMCKYSCRDLNKKMLLFTHMHTQFSRGHLGIGGGGGASTVFAG